MTVASHVDRVDRHSTIAARSSLPAHGGACLLYWWTNGGEISLSRCEVVAMISRLGERARWIERHLLPVEPRVRKWLSRNRTIGLDADDIIQEMYARIGTVDNLDDIRDPLLYAIKVAQSIILNHVRRSRIVGIDAVGDMDDYDIPSQDPSPEDEVASRDEVDLVIKALDGLPERTRNVLMLRRVEGLSQRDTAERLKIAEKTVEKHMTQAALYLTMLFGRGGKLKL
jgi:RNA polymerase sigma-70 factor (ECF subfamily)